jgi:hypothetical protein
MKPIVNPSIFVVPMIINVSVWVKSIATATGIARPISEIHTEMEIYTFVKNKFDSIRF